MKKNYLRFSFLLLLGIMGRYSGHSQNPVANTDYATVCPNSMGLFLNILANDTDADGTIDYNTVDLDPSTPTLETSFFSDGLTFTVDAIGFITCSPAIAYGSFSLTYTVKDDTGLVSNLAYINIYFAPYVLAQNDDFTALVIDATVGGITPSVLDNDLVSGGSVFGLYASFQDSGTPFIMNPNGTITIAPGSTPGNYFFYYEASVLGPNCMGNFATVTFTIDNLFFYADVDGDGYGDPTAATVTVATPGYVGNNTDCDDTNAAIHYSGNYYVDADHDTYGTGSLSPTCGVDATTIPYGYSSNNTDCDDADSSIFVTASYYLDADHDHYGVVSLVALCTAGTAPTGYASNNTDCNDGDTTIYRNGTLFVDADSDGYDGGAMTVCYGTTLAVPSGYVTTTNGSDCNDTDAAITNGCFSVPSNCGNTFVRTIDGNGSGFIKPNIFKHPSGDFYATNTFGNNVILSRYNPNGVIIWSKKIDFANTDMVLQDLTVDATDNTIAGIVYLNYQEPFNTTNITNRNGFIFKFNETTQTFDWVEKVINNTMFNIHQTDATTYAITSHDLSTYNVSMMKIDKATGAHLGAVTGMGGEFYSTYYSGSLYGASRYYADSNSQFFPSIYKWDVATATNQWTKTYMRDTPVARIYPIAPIVDAGSLVVLSSGNDANFDSVYDGNTKLFLLKTDLNGNLNWTKQISIAGYNRFVVTKIINTATGYYLLLSSYNGAKKDFSFIIKTDKNGDVVWANRYGNTGENIITGGIESNGYLYITGTTESLSATQKMFLLKLDLLGQTDASCTFINPVTATATVYTNLETNRTPVQNILARTLTSELATQTATSNLETTYCSTNCSLLANNTQNAADHNIEVFPNPAEHLIHVNTSAPMQRITLFDINGRQLQTIVTANTKAETIDITALDSGMYLIEIQTETGKSIQKIIKK